MTTEQFRRLALSLPNTSEQSHVGHPDFRVRGRIFATAGYPRAGWAMIKLTLDQQRQVVHADPAIFMPVPGGWGRRGATAIRLRAATKGKVEAALLTAWRNVARPALKR
jgi:hypothetical protein